VSGNPCRYETRMATVWRIKAITSFASFDPQLVAPGRCGGHVAVHGRDKYLTSFACGGVALGSQ
jgi:hypothetical protein